jgi:isohexenylglutaconyl-CoA hydratase
MCACDISVATEDAAFALTETALGIPPAQIAPFVRAQIGLAKARQLMLTAPRFNGLDAGKLGLVSTVVADAEALDAEEAELRDALRRCAPGAVAVTKDILLRQAEDDSIATAARAFAGCILSEEGREGVTSFFEKRPPCWAQIPEDQA